MVTPLITRKALLTADVESVYGTAPIMDGGDAVLVMDPDYTVDPTVLERNFVRNDLSPMAHAMGRKLAGMSFKTELRGNGLVQSGLVADAPRISRLFRACGYSMTAKSVLSCTTPKEIGDHAVPVSWVVAGTMTQTAPIAYYLEVTTGGASGTAKITITSDTTGEAVAAAAVTSGAAITVGTKGVTLTPTWSGNLTLGQRWVAWALPKGVILEPVSDGFESGAFKLYLDGVLHTMNGAFGTFTINAEAGQYATIDWNFSGQYSEPTDVPMISGNFETTIPPVVELARLQVNGFNSCVNAFSFDQSNDIQIRPCVSASDGYEGTRIVGRSPTGGIDPEATLVADNAFMSDLATAARMPFHMTVGNDVGNTVYMMAPNVQYTGMTYQDRNGIRAFDAGLRFNRVNGDDEFSIFFG